MRNPSYMYYLFLEELDRKISYSRLIDVEDIVLPNCSYYEKGELKAYSVPKIKEIDLCATLSKVKSLSLLWYF